MILRTFVIAIILVGLFTSSPLSAAVMRFEIESRSPMDEGQAFGDAGPYEKIAGKVYFAIDPALPQNEPIVDLNLAPRNDEGRVEFSADLFILAPADLNKASGALLYDVNNRGNKLAVGFFNDAGSENRNAGDNPGNGFLMRQGMIVAWSGWDGELLPDARQMQLFAPVARQNGRPITGPVRYEFVPTGDTARMNVNWVRHGSYRPTEKGLAEATLTWRLRPDEPRVPIPREQYRIHVTDVVPPTDGQLPLVEVEMPAGLRKSYIYELIYEARDPTVHGVTFAHLRDLIAALKHGAGQGNPLMLEGKPVVRRAHGFGVSQSGRYLREFLYFGFNRDEQGRQVFDGLMPHVAGGGLGSFNHRFAQPAAYGSQHERHDYVPDRFPFSYETQTDPVSGRTDGILRRAEASDTVPLVMHTYSSAEYWSRSGSLVHTDPLGKRDAEIPDRVRLYAFGGTQHGPGSFPPSHGDGQNLANPADYKPFLRALLLALDRWATDDVPPPPSVYPRISGGTLVDWRQASTGFPSLPGVRYPEVIQQPSLWDYGPRWPKQGIMDRQPPKHAGDYRVLVARCDADGNVEGCLLPPEVAAPLATFTGWNLRSRQAGAQNELVSLVGSYLPFPATQAERETTIDPRRSLEERYGTIEGYLKQLTATCNQLVDRGYLLSEDVPRILIRQQKRAALEGMQ